VAASFIRDTRGDDATSSEREWLEKAFTAVGTAEAAR
jgi:DUF1365 family protein